MSELNDFVREALKVGKSRDDVRSALERAGWQRDEVDDALAAYAEADFPIPVPRPRRYGSAKDALLYLVTFSMLYASAIPLGVILTALINLAVPDSVHDPDPVTRWQHESILGSLASLIVAFPIYVLLTRSHIKRYPVDPGRRTSVVRKWLTSLTMFGAFCVFIGFLIGLIYSVLTGEVALRSFLKSIVVLGLSAGVYVFYRWELKIGEEDDA